MPIPLDLNDVRTCTGTYYVGTRVIGMVVCGWFRWLTLDYYVDLLFYKLARLEST